MVECPHCHSNVEKPVKVFQNADLWCVSEYNCGKCKNRFIISKE